MVLKNSWWVLQKDEKSKMQISRVNSSFSLTSMFHCRSCLSLDLPLIRNGTFSRPNLITLLCLLAEKNVDLLLDPVLRIGSVGVGCSLIDNARQISQVVDEIEQLGDIIRDRRQAWVTFLQVVLEHVANPWTQR